MGAQTRIRVVASVVALIAAALMHSPSSGAQTSSVVINEIVASNSQIYADGDGDFTDWIELYNPTAAAIDLSGWQISDSLASWSLPTTTTIAAGGYLVIFASDKGNPGDPAYPGPAGELHTDFKLTSAGETVTLTDALASVVDSVTYPPLATDTSYGTAPVGGYAVRTLAQVSPLAANPAPAPTPTPTPTPLPGPASLVFNEVMPVNDTVIADGDGDYSDWFELYNPTCDTVDLTGWQVADSSGAWSFPTGLTMGPGEVIVVWASDKGDPEDVDYPGPAWQLHASFRIAGEGETLSLVDAGGYLVASVTTPTMVADEALARQAGDTLVVVSGAAVSHGALNPGQVAPTCAPTPTPDPAATATPVPTTTPAPPTDCAVTIVINEIMARNEGALADGDGDYSDWIELHNPNPYDISLAGWTLADFGSRWSFPDDAVIDAGEYLLVWASDKADRSHPQHPGPPGELHAGFRLASDGETVTLTDAARCQVDQMTYPSLDENESFGRTDSGTAVFRFGQPTPGEANGSPEPQGPPTCYSSAPPPVVMARIVARNSGLALDGDGDSSDFIELYNSGLVAVDLTFWQISASADTWTLPVGTEIGAGSTLMVWASGKGLVTDEGFPGPPGELHTNFGLSSRGELVTLAEPSSCIVDQVTYPSLGTDEAYAFNAAGERVVLVPGAASTTGECPDPGTVVISALMSRNDSVRADEDGDFGDWIELTNPGDKPVQVGGWALADDGGVWIMPDDVTIGAGDTLIVWADDKNRGQAGDELHANFKLSGDGETLTLGPSLDCAVTQVSFPELDDDQIYVLGGNGVYAVQGIGGGDGDEGDEGDDAAGGGAAGVVASGSCLAITEVMAKNDTTIEDADGEFGDWIELTNLGDEPIDLTGYTVADDGDQWRFPDGVVIEPGEFVVVWADEGERGEVGDELHTNFKLSGDGETVTVRDTDGAIATMLVFPELGDDESFGVDEDGMWRIIAVGEATPGDWPTVSDGCGYAVGGTGGGDADDDADEPAEDGGSELAVTGTNPWPRVLAQVLLLPGLALLAMATISRRRAALSGVGGRHQG